MAERGGGHPALDSCIFGRQLVVCDCVVEESQFPIPPSMDTVGMVLVGYHWIAFEDRTSILMTPRLQELRLKELVKGLDAIKKHIQAGNLGLACERLYAAYSELKMLSRRRKTK
jgi:hypothetical protein